MTSARSGSEIIERLKRAVFPSYALLAAIQLDLFTTLKDGPRSAEEIAATMGVKPNKLQALLYPMVLIGLLEVSEERFGNTAEANRFLIRGGADYLGDEYVAFTKGWSQVRRTVESIKTGTAQAKLDFSSMSSEALELFYQASHSQLLAAGRGLLRQYDFSPYRHLLDVGGGTGGLAIALAEACPSLHATVVDYPSVTPITQRFIDASKAVGRLQVISADIVNQPLTGSFDVAVLRNFIPVLSVNRVPQALSNVYAVLEPGGVIYITDIGTLDDSRLSPPEIVWQNLWFINVFDGGGASTEQQRRDWLTKAGFEQIERNLQANGVSVMVAKKPG